MYHIFIIQTLILSYASGSIFKVFLEILTDTEPLSNLYDILTLNLVFTLIGIVLLKFFPNLNFKIFIEKQTDKSIFNVFNVVVNIFASILIISSLYLLFSATLLTRFFSDFGYKGFSCFNGLINGGILCYILENKLFKLPEINKTQKMIGYCLYTVTYLILIYI